MRVRSVPTSKRTRITVLLGDPRLPYAYNLSRRFETHDYETVRQLKSALSTLTDYEFDFLDEHALYYEGLRRNAPPLVLNFCNTGYGNRISRQLHIPALLEMLDIAYIGAGPACLALCHDKNAVLHIATDLGIPVPKQRFVKLVGGAHPKPETYPALIKPNHGDGSIGIEPDALVYNDSDAARYLRRLAELLDRPGLVIEDYLPGPEYSVGLIGNPGTGFASLPPLEVDYSALDPVLPPILTYAAKVDPGSAYWRQIRLREAPISLALREQLESQCRGIFTRLDCRDYARFDFRCDNNGEPRLIDVNCHPMWGADGMMASMAGFAGHGYAVMLDLIIRAGLERVSNAL